MLYNYYCPNCDHQFNKNEKLHFLVSFKNAKKVKLQLSKEPGVYGYKSNHNLTINNGDLITFFCEKCEVNLQSINRPDFVKIDLRVSNEIIFELLFSPVCGDKKTYVIMEGELVKYGSDFLSIMSSKKST
ncbi:MAG: hypothetical protein ACI865_000667 [Flavobacteriaceae bacterium]|jgi:hypothetical protein